MNDSLKTLIGALKAMEDAFGGHFCIHLYDGEVWRMNEIAPVFHDNTFCCRVKLGLGQNISACTGFDMTRVRTECLKRRDIFFKRCQFGAFEIVIPVFDNDDHLRLIVFYGPFRIRGKISGLVEPESYCVINESLTRELEKAQRALPFIDLVTAERIGRICAGMTGNFNAVLSVNDPPDGSRAGRINDFFFRRFRDKSASLDELAGFLSLSISRTSHVLRKEFGMTFPDMLKRCRLEYAKKLLSETFLNTGTVAELSGFSSPQYFYRQFRKHFNMTPSVFRQRNIGRNMPEDV